MSYLYNKMSSKPHVLWSLQDDREAILQKFSVLDDCVLCTKPHNQGYPFRLLAIGVLTFVSLEMELTPSPVSSVAEYLNSPGT